MISNQATTTGATSSKTSSISASTSTRAARKPATDSVEEVEFVGVRCDYDEEGQRPRTRAELQRRQAREKMKRKVKIELPRQLEGETLCPIPECRKKIYVAGGCRTITCYNKLCHPKNQPFVYFCAYCKNTSKDEILRGCPPTCPENFNALDRLEYCQVIHPVNEDDDDASAMESDSIQRHFSSDSVSTTSNGGVSEPDVYEDDVAKGGSPASRDRRNTALITFENDVSVKREPDAVVSSAYDEDTVNDDETVYPEEVKSAITNVPTASDRKTSKSRSALDTASTTDVVSTDSSDSSVKASAKKRKSQSSNDEGGAKKKKIDWRKYRKTCSAVGCTNVARKGGVCKKHGAKVKDCSIEGCTNNAQNGGVCKRHGAKIKECSAEGCTNGAVKGGVCIRHGAKIKECVKECSADGCTNQAVRGGVCIKHGAQVKFKSCSADGCTNRAKKEGVCVRHGAKVKVKKCSADGCTNQARNGGVCILHGAKVKLCSADGCSNKVQKRGLCCRHGAYSERP